MLDTLNGPALRAKSLADAYQEGIKMCEETDTSANDTLLITLKDARAALMESVEEIVRLERELEKAHKRIQTAELWRKRYLEK